MMGERVSIRKNDGSVFSVDVPDAWGPVMLYRKHADGGVTVHTEAGCSLKLHPSSSEASERWLLEYLASVRVPAITEAQTAGMLLRVLRGKPNGD
jgi:hypothetical protein